jgi:transcriptional regulator with XRE-family HTH domain
MLQSLAYLPDRLALARQMRGQSQVELAVLSGIPQPTISKLERRLIADPSLGMVAALAEALGLSLSALVDPDPSAFALEIEVGPRSRSLDGEPRQASALLFPAGPHASSDWSASLLGFDGSVLAICTNEHFVVSSARQRRKLGRVDLFDPCGLLAKKRLPTGCKRVGWNPLAGCEEWSQAQRTAVNMIEIALGAPEPGNTAFFKAMSRQTLPFLLYAAAVMNEDMRRVIRWLYRINDQPTQSEIDAILRWKGNVRALDAWTGFVTKEAKLRSDIAATVSSALVAYEDEQLQRAMLEPALEEPFTGKDTVYVVLPPERLYDLRPALHLYLQTILEPTLSRVLPEPLLVVIDDVARRAEIELPERLRPLLGAARLATAVW